LKKLKDVGKLALDTNAVIAYREGISEVCKLIDEANIKNCLALRTQKSILIV
jgi:hypothetical protein